MAFIFNHKHKNCPQVFEERGAHKVVFLHNERKVKLVSVGCHRSLEARQCDGRHHVLDLALDLQSVLIRTASEFLSSTDRDPEHGDVVSTLNLLDNLVAH